MSRWENEQAARQEILSLVSDYYHTSINEQIQELTKAVRQR